MARIEFESYKNAPVSGAATTPPEIEAALLLNLGLDTSSGRDCAPDLVTAHKWFNLAALKGNAEAQRYRQEISQEMSKSEIAAAQRAAREWLQKH
ncbi:MAG: hypothetical protein K8F25_18940 [Fimbriimonadaceae bacterium]|nr:hypothetical protein [Alphaproteobacteria bacterium]